MGDLELTLAELADCIERTHHAYLYAEIPRLNAMIDKVCAAHGEKDARLERIRDTFLSLAREMASHMMKEEQILFPMIRQLEASETLPYFHCGSLASPIRQMEAEHDQAGAALRSLRHLTDGFTPPDWACSTYKTMLNALSALESDMRQHVHKENNVLFPRAMKLEEEMGRPLKS